MRYILAWIICLSCFPVRSQFNQELRMCDGETSYIYWVETHPGYDYEWKITPEPEYKYANNDVFLVRYSKPGKYLIQARYMILGCDGEYGEFSINVRLCDSTSFFIPNSFSPDGDGKNDLFQAKGLNVKEFEMWIFDRWGEEVFYTNTLDNGWNGSKNNSSGEPFIEVYNYRIHYRNLDGELQVKQGTVTIVK